MNIDPITLDSIEKYIHYLSEHIEINALIMPRSNKIKDKIEHKSDLDNAQYHEFISFADYHYFISRILFMNHLYLYSLFAGQQCIENYLKAFIKYKDQTPDEIHPLSILLETCKKIANKTDDFILSNEIVTIIYKYEPFNEIPRYPVTKTTLNGWGCLYPNDIYILDYFVFKFRELLPFPKQYHNIMEENHIYITSCKNDSPDVYKMFIDGNINFSK